MDAKEVGLGVKNLVVGIASAVAGGYGGAPAASGVLMAGSAIDTLVEAGTNKKETRAERYDRADYAARPTLAPKQAPPTPPSDQAEAVALLREVGYGAAQIEKIQAGPAHFTVSDILPPQVDGKRVPLSNGNRVALADGQRIPEVPGSADPRLEGS